MEMTALSIGAYNLKQKGRRQEGGGVLSVQLSTGEWSHQQLGFIQGGVMVVGGGGVGRASPDEGQKCSSPSRH